MHSTQQLDRNHLFVLPSGLDCLERDGIVPGTDELKLINSDPKTLVWSQRLVTGEKAVLKLYRHRGPVDWTREKLFRFRVQREYDALMRLENCGIPCSKPEFWASGICRKYGRCELLVTREILDSVPLDVFVKSRGSRITDEELDPLYALIARMHQHGFHHGALYTRNILATEIESGKPSFHFIDVPKAISFPFAITETRMATIDLSDLSLELAGMIGFDRCVPLLKKYGFDQPSAYRFVRRLQQYRPTKHTRNRNRAECEFRELLAKGARSRQASPSAKGMAIIPAGQKLLVDGR